MDSANTDTDMHRQGPDVNGAIWQNFVESSSQETFCVHWLGLLSSMVGGVSGAMVLLGTPDQGPFSPVAVWPDSALDMQPLVPAAEQVLVGRQGLLLEAAASVAQIGKVHHVAYPLEVENRLYGCVVLEVTDRPEDGLQSVLRQVHWGAAWLELLFRRRDAEQYQAKLQRTAAVLELTATTVQAGDFHHVAMALVNELATRLQCDRVSIGHVKKNFVHLLVISHTARFDKKTNLARSLETAMEEALDQRCTMTYPHSADDGVVNRLHGELAHRSEASAVCTVLLPGREAVFGALTLERFSGEKETFAPETIEICTTIAHLAGPILESHWQNERWLGGRIYDSCARLAQRLFGPSHLALKLISTTTLVLIVFAALMKVEYRVSAKTVVEGSIQRVVPAPFDGFLASAEVRAGDVVRKGQLLCALDDKDMSLERARWLSEGEQYRRKYREAMASYERAVAAIAQAQIRQGVALLDEKLSRARIEASFEGVVVSGDLSQRLGSPVKQGDELFKLAPLDNYRVIIQVDERDIAHVRGGQNGSLILSGLPQETFPFTVKTVTPVSVAEGGQNYFRVEALLQKGSDHLRPGMEGIGKIESGKRALIWVWTHRLIDWIRLRIWSWWP